MLTRLRLFFAMLLLIAWLPGTAHAAPHCLKLDPSGTICLLRADTDNGPGDDDGGDDSSRGGSRSAHPGECLFGGRAVRCRTTAGEWSNAQQAWCKDMSETVPLDHPAWGGRTEGHVVRCVRPGGSLVPDPALWFYSWRADTSLPPPDPEDMARRILASLELSAPELHTFPQGDTKQHMTYTGWHTWLWSAAPSAKQWGPVSSSMSERGVTVTLTATVRRVVWDMGNGETVTCGKGTPWSTTRSNGGRNVASPDCDYVYERMGHYEVTARSEWDVSWSSGGASGTLPLELSRTAPMRVGELQSVLVNR
ncbi:MAG: hypothetical protein QM713_05440 [Arachnia sp.]